jgi:hypothetical protein
MTKGKKREADGTRGVIALKDLIPRNDPRGGAARRGRTVFGGGPALPVPEPGEPAGKKRPGKKSQ